MELLVRIIDKYSGEDLKTQAKTTHAGDVIAIQEDGSYWGPSELQDPQFVIMRSSIYRAEAEALTTPEIGDPLVRPLLHIRGFHLDLVALRRLGYSLGSVTLADEIMGLVRKISDLTDAIGALKQSGHNTDEMRKSQQRLIHAYVLAIDPLIVEVKVDDIRAAKSQKASLVDPTVIG